MLTAEEIRIIVQRVVDIMQPEKVIIFGSYAKGTQTSRSDLDLFVVKDSYVHAARRADSLQPMLSGPLVRVDVHVYTPEEVEEYGRDQFSFVSSVLRSGTTIFECALQR